MAVSGGDGTVGKVAGALIGTRTPIAILPMGTANNIATTLGLTGKSLPELVKGWGSARPVNFDAGIAKGPWGSEYFIESFGVGLFAETMFKINDKLGGLELSSSRDAKKAVAAVIKILNDQLEKLDPKEMVVQLDGRDVSGNYVLLEVLNIRYVGPNLDLVPRAEINDGWFDVVFVTEAQRAKLRKYLMDRTKQKDPTAKLTVRRGQHLQIEWQNSPIHIDDTAWPKRKHRTPLRSNIVDIRIDPAALVFLMPAEAKQSREKRRI